jgi:hypothetical protein
MNEPSRDELLDVVRRVWSERDPVPEGLVARMQAVAAAADTDLDLELMLLAERSDELAGARGTAAAYTLRFRYGDRQLLLRVAADGESRRVDGWVTPPTAMTVRVVSARGDRQEWQAAVSDRGRFELPGLPPGLVRLRLEPDEPGTPALGTPAFEI